MADTRTASTPNPEILKQMEKLQDLFGGSKDTLDEIIVNLNTKMVDALKNANDQEKKILEKTILRNTMLAQSIKHFATANQNGGQFIKTMQNLVNTTNPFLFLLEQAASRFSELDMAGEKFRTETGLLASQTKLIEQNIRSVSRDMAEFGVDIEKATVASKVLTNVFGDQFMASNKSNVEYIALMSANLGVVEEDSAKVLSNFMGMNKMSSETARYMTAQAASLAKAAGVPFAKVMKEVSNASGATLAAIRGSVPELIKAAVTAERLGTDLNKVGAAAEKMLDFQSSIADEMEASVLLGKDLNLQKMRELAYAGDLDGLANEQARLLNQLGDLSKMDFYQKQASAKALGMSVEEMTKMNAKQTELVELQKQNPELAKRYQEELDKINNLNKESNKDLSKKYEQELKSKQIQSEQTKLANQFKELLTDIQDVLVPIAKGLMQIANFVVLILKPVGLLFNLFGTIVDSVDKLIHGSLELGDIWGSFGTKVKNTFGNFTDIEHTIKSIISLSGLLILPILAFSAKARSLLMSVFQGPANYLRSLSGDGESSEPTTGAEDVGKKMAKGAKKGTPAGANKAMGTNIKDFLSNLAKGIKSFNPLSEILKGLLGIAASGPAFLIFATALPGLLVAMLAGATGPLIKTGMQAIAAGIKAMDIAKIGMGVLGVLALGAAFIPFTFALSLLTGVSPTAILASVAAMYALGAGAIFLGSIFASGIGAALFFAGVAGIAALGLAFIPFGKAAQMAGEGMQSFGSAVKDIAANISQLASLKEILGVFNDVSLIVGISAMTAAIQQLNEQLLALSLLSANVGNLNIATTSGGKSSNDAVVSKLDELIGLLQSGAIGVNIDGSKASMLLARAQKERGAFGAV
jgi:hypothetical protein